MAIKKLGYRLYKNASKTKAKSPYLATVESAGSVGLDEIVAEVAKKSNGDEIAVRVCYQAMLDVIREELVKGYKVQTPFGLIEPAISGTMDSEDAPFDPARNELYVKITPSDELRDAVGGLVPERLDAPVSELSITTVISPLLGRGGYNTIRAGEPFTVCGGGFEDGIKVTLTDAQGGVHSLTVEMVKDISMICRADGPMAKGAGTLTVVVSGGGESETVNFTASRKVKVV